MNLNQSSTGESSDTIVGPPAPPPSMHRAFPDWITMNWELFMRGSVPGWVPDRHLERQHPGPLYQSTVGEDGEPLCTRRMAFWLSGLPESIHGVTPVNESSQQHHGHRRSSSAILGGRHRCGRPRSMSVPHAPTGNLIPNAENQLQHTEPVIKTVAAPQSPSFVAQDMGMDPTRPTFQHPNPLGQHPVQHERFLGQPHIPQRRSSLFFHERRSDDMTHPPSSSRRAAPQENTNKRILSRQLDDRLEAHASLQDQTDRAAIMGRREDEVQRLFGPDTGNDGQNKKRALSITRTATGASQPPAKRIRRTLTSARNRLSRVMTPTGTEDAGDGRQSRLDRLTDAAKRMSLAAPPAQPMIRVIGFGPGVAKERVKIAFIGDAGVGKTAFIQAFRTDLYDESGPAAAAERFTSGYGVDTVNVVLDGIPVVCETWDVSNQRGKNGFEDNTIRPLLMTFYDLVVICYDISDEATLKAAQTKWAHDAERYCTGSPTILLGLKADLRRPLPSLRLTHLREPTQTSFGQGEQAAKKMGVEAHYEASAKTGEGVADFFESTIRFALSRRSSVRREVPGPVSRAKKAWEGIKRHLG